MDLLYTSRFRVDLLTKVFVLLFVCGVNTAESYKIAVACYSRGVCYQMTLSCTDEQIIRLVDQQYNFVENKEHHCNTSGINNAQCNQYSQGNCCVIQNKQCMTPVSKVQTLTLFDKCSGKQMCSTQATQGRMKGCTPINNTLADSNFLTYDCDNETDTVQLCSNMSRKSNSINVIFNGTSTMTSYTTSQTCSCSISSTAQYHAYLQDFRSFRPGNTYKCSSMSLNGNGKMCNRLNKENDFIYQSPLNITNHTITARNLFSQGPDDRPTMVWIRIKSYESVPLTVTCTGAVPTVGSPSTTKPSSGSATSITTKPSSGSATSTTTPSISTNTGTSVGGTADENKVPVAAIVVPLLLVLLGSAAAVTSVWFWRKRRKAATEKNTNISNEQQNVTSGVTSGVSSGRISGTDRTYDLPEEDEYSTVDGNGLANSSCESDNYGYIVPAVAMRADDTPEYEVPVHLDCDGGEEHAYSILDKVDQQ